MKKGMIVTVLFAVGVQLTGCTFGEPQMGKAGTVGTWAAAPLESISGTEETITGRTENQISEQEAKEIALERVPGAVIEDIWEFKLDYDDGRTEYDGKIYFQKNEYEFEIDAHTGEILNWEAESIRD